MEEVRLHGVTVLKENTSLQQTALGTAGPVSPETLNRVSAVG